MQSRPGTRYMSFKVLHQEQRWEFHPTSWLTRWRIVGSTVGLILCLAIVGGIAWNDRLSHGGLICASLPMILGLILFGATLRYLRHRSTPLIVERDGRISYGRRDLCAAREVEAVHLIRLEGGEDCYYFRAYLLLAGGNRLALPAPYFDSFGSSEEGLWFARKMAKILEIAVVKGPTEKAMPEPKFLSPLFDIQQNGGRWECRPIGFWSLFGAVFLLVGAGFLLYLSSIFFWDIAGSWQRLGVGSFLLLPTCLLAWQSSRFWRLRRVPLVVEGNGRVSYDGKELCPPGSVQSVQIVPDPHAESGDCKIVFQLSEGTQVDLEGPFFSSVSHREPARGLATELARALKVEVVE